MKKWRKLFLPFAILPGLAYFVVAGFQTVVRVPLSAQRKTAQGQAATPRQKRLPGVCFSPYKPAQFLSLLLPFAILPGLAYFVVAGFQTVVPAFSMVGSRMGEVFYLTVAALVPQNQAAEPTSHSVPLSAQRKTAQGQAATPRQKPGWGKCFI